MVLAAVAVFVMVIAVGVAIDMARDQTTLSKVGGALDAAGLAAGGAVKAALLPGGSCNGHNGGDLTSCLTGVATTASAKYVKANFPAGYLGVSNVTPAVAVNMSDRSISLTIDTSEQTSLMSVVGVNSVPVHVFSKVSFGASGAQCDAAPTGPSVDGQCGATYDTCKSGTFSNARTVVNSFFGNAHDWPWMCMGTGAGKNAICHGCPDGSCAVSTDGSPPVVTTGECNAFPTVDPNAATFFAPPPGGNFPASTTFAAEDMAWLNYYVSQSAINSNFYVDPTTWYLMDNIQLCSAGAAVNIARDPIKGIVSWTCAGEGTGSTNVSCSIDNCSLAGQCLTTVSMQQWLNGNGKGNFCTLGAGTINNMSAGYLTWTCQGSDNTPPTACSATVSTPFVNGQCGSASGVAAASTPTGNLCANGSTTGVTKSGDSWTWTCQGEGGGSNASCSALAISQGSTCTVGGGSCVVYENFSNGSLGCGDPAASSTWTFWGVGQGSKGAGNTGCSNGATPTFTDNGAALSVTWNPSTGIYTPATPVSLGDVIAFGCPGTVAGNCPTLPDTQACTTGGGSCIAYKAADGSVGCGDPSHPGAGYPSTWIFWGAGGSSSGGGAICSDGGTPMWSIPVTRDGSSGNYYPSGGVAVYPGESISYTCVSQNATSCTNSLVTGGGSCLAYKAADGSIGCGDPSHPSAGYPSTWSFWGTGQSTTQSGNTAHMECSSGVAQWSLPVSKDPTTGKMSVTGIALSPGDEIGFSCKTYASAAAGPARPTGYGYWIGGTGTDFSSFFFNGSGQLACENIQQTYTGTTTVLPLTNVVVGPVYGLYTVSGDVHGSSCINPYVSSTYLSQAHYSYERDTSPSNCPDTYNAYWPGGVGEITSSSCVNCAAGTATGMFNAYTCTPSPPAPEGYPYGIGYGVHPACTLCDVPEGISRPNGFTSLDGISYYGLSCGPYTCYDFVPNTSANPPAPPAGN